MEDDLQLETQEDAVALMEELLDRLKLLNYQKDFLASKGAKPLSPGYFVNPTNASEQFNYFKTLSKWLLQLCEMNVSDISKFQDPLTVATNIQTQCKRLDIPCDFPALKLKSGSGENVIFILSQLSAKALTKKRFAFKRPKYDQTAAEGQEIIEIGGNQQEEDDVVDNADSDVEEVLEGGIAAVEPEDDKQMINANINEKDWQMECKRVATKLKGPSKGSTKEWRSHIDSTKGNSDAIKEGFPNAKLILQKMNEDLTRNLQRIQKAERDINQQMSEKGSSFKSKAEEFKQTSLIFNNLTHSMKELNEQYKQIIQRLEKVNHMTNEHGNSMSDNSAVVKLRAAIQRLSGQIKTMDVRIGVLNYTVFQQRMKDKRVDYRSNELNFNLLDEFGDEG